MRYVCRLSIFMLARLTATSSSFFTLSQHLGVEKLERRVGLLRALGRRNVVLEAAVVMVDDEQVGIGVRRRAPKEPEVPVRVRATPHMLAPHFAPVVRGHLARRSADERRAVDVARVALAIVAVLPAPAGGLVLEKSACLASGYDGY